MGAPPGVLFLLLLEQKFQCFYFCFFFGSKHTHHLSQQLQCSDSVTGFCCRLDDGHQLGFYTLWGYRKAHFLYCFLYRRSFHNSVGIVMKTGSFLASEAVCSFVAGRSIPETLFTTKNIQLTEKPFFLCKIVEAFCSHITNIIAHLVENTKTRWYNIDTKSYTW